MTKRVLRIENLEEVTAGATIDVSVKFLVSLDATTSKPPLREVMQTTKIWVYTQPLVASVSLYNDNITSSRAVSFTTKEMVLDAGESRDPDNLNALLSFKWGCPEELSSVCPTGVTQSKLILNAVDRVRLIQIFGKTYTFNVTVSNPQNPYKKPITVIKRVLMNIPEEIDS